MPKEEFQLKLEKAKEGAVVTLDLKQSPQSKYPSVSLVYIPPGKKVNNVDFLKKLVEEKHLVFIVVSGKNIREVKRKVESLLIDPGQETNEERRVDILPIKLLHYDMAKNGHATSISKPEAEEMTFATKSQQIKKKDLAPLPVNDPRVMFYGYDIGDIVTVEFASETCGIGTMKHYISQNAGDEKAAAVFYI